MFKQLFAPLAAFVFLLFAGSCAKRPIDAAHMGAPVNHPGDSAVFAIIGDFGEDSPGEAAVASMVKGWNPEFIVTVGDNNYPLGSASTIANNVGKHYGDYIYNPDAPADRVCTGMAAQEKVNRFFPSPGNHDNYAIPKLKPYKDYFTLPGDELNYDFSWGPVQFFSLNGGAGGIIKQPARNWLKSGLAQSTKPFKLVFFHQPPYSPGPHGSATGTQLPYGQWGADAVLGGHEHFYVRLTENSAPNKPLYLIIGNSGNENLYKCSANPLDPNKFTINVCDNDHFGAIKVTTTATQMVFQYFTTSDLVNPRDVTILTK